VSARVHRAWCLAGALAALTACTSVPVERAGANELAALAWLEGTWICDSAPGEVTEESWGHARGGWMLGAGRTLRSDGTGERVVGFEFLRIEQRADGLVYVAQPGGRAPATEFRLVESTRDAWCFENPTHDFPRRIHYQRHGDSAFTASLSGLEGDQPLQFELEFRRAAR